MIKVRTAELNGVALDWAVAKAIGLSLSCDAVQPRFILVGEGDGDLRPFSPSTDWQQGGSLIEQFQIYLKPPHDEHRNYGSKRPGEWVIFPYWNAVVSAKVGNLPPKYDSPFPIGGVARGDGETPLVAACRAIVLLKLGEEVEVPQELVS